MQAPIAAWSMAFPISMSLGCINMHKLIWDKGHSTLEHLRLFATIKSIKSFSKLDQGPIETNERSWRARRNTGQMLSTKCSLFDRSARACKAVTKSRFAHFEAPSFRFAFVCAAKRAGKRNSLSKIYTTDEISICARNTLHFSRATRTTCSLRYKWIDNKTCKACQHHTIAVELIEPRKKVWN